MRYACLGGRSAYQFGESCLSMGDYARRAKALGYSAIGVADRAVVYAFPELFDAARKYGLHAVAGCEVRLDHPRGTKQTILFVENEVGYSNLCYILSLNKSGFSLADIQGHTEGLTAVFPKETLGDEESEARILLDLSRPFSHVYIGVTIRSEDDIEAAERIREFASSHSYLTIALPRVCYTGKRGAFILRTIAADRDRRALTKEELDPESEGGPDFLLSPKVLEKLYLPQEIQHASDLAFGCTFNLFSRPRGHMLSFTGSKEEDDRELRENTYRALEEKKLSGNPAYVERLDHELDTIAGMSFSSYFLIVADYVSQAKAKGIAVGPGRGSACGCLCAYLLGITQIDPLKYGLSFERFLNPKRVTMPDIDIDFQHDRRDEVLDYLKAKYGEMKVSQIMTFQTYKARSALSSACKAFGMPESRISGIRKLIGNSTESLSELIRTNPKLSQIYEDSYYHRAIETAVHMEGLPIGTSIHAAGCIISDSDICTSCPLSEGRIGISEYQYPYLERMGFLKVDLLSLNYLTTIKEVENLVVKDGGTIPDYQLVRNDAETYKTICDLRLMGVFQLTGEGIRRAINQIQPQNFDDLVALLALYRPGPMGSIPLYAQRKKTGQIPSFGYRVLDSILKETYGIIIYQEQILRIVHEVAGLDMGEADLLRRAISKKDEAKMASYREKFIQGCLDRGMTKADAEGVYDVIDRFAAYGFNKSHSVAYALITFQTAYLKTHFPKEFFTVLSQSVPPSAQDFKRMVNEMEAAGIGIEPPSVQYSELENSVVGDNLCIGLKQVKSLGQSLSEAIVQEREGGEFKGAGDFLLRVNRRFKLDSRAIRSLSQSGVLDGLGASRKCLEEKADEIAEALDMALDESMLPVLEDTKPSELELVKEFVRELDSSGVSLRIDLEKLFCSIPQGFRVGAVTQVSSSLERLPSMEVASRYGRMWFTLPERTRVNPYDVVAFKPVRPMNRNGRWSATRVAVKTPKD